jgi:hypothetical protein
MQVLTTGVLNNSRMLASVCVSLKSQPENNVVVSASVYPYQLKAAPGTQGDPASADSDLSKFVLQPVLTLTFHYYDWFTKKCIQLLGVLDPEKTANYTTPLDLKVRMTL